jgi:membrane protease YdiL (CAAX protease family)
VIEPYDPMVTLMEGGVDVLLDFVLLLMLVWHRERLLPHWRRGAVVAFLVLMLAVPQHIGTLVFLDPQALFEGEGGLGVGALGGGAARVGLFVSMMFGTALRMVWYGLLTCLAVSEWQRLRPARPLLGDELPPRWRRLLVGLGIGTLLGGLTVLAFDAAGVDAGRAIEDLKEYFPALAEGPAVARVAVALPLAVSAALVEEIVFRGVLLGALLRAGKEAPGIVLASVLATSVAWACLHLSITDMPGIKLLQIFFFGLILAELARRWSLESAIAAHLGLNLTGLGLMLLV